jgi:uncharacterized protein (AIM24 family)
VQVTDLGQRLACGWCHAQSSTGSLTCDRCGAPLDVRDVVSDSGWRQAPRLRDLTEISFGASTAQIDGDTVPVAEIRLDGGDTVFFEHHVMLWKDDEVPMSVMSTPGGARRLLGDVPFVLSVAHGPGRLAFCREAPGELVVLPVDPGVTLDVRGHALVVASGALGYSFSKVPGLRTVLMAGTGMYFDRFEASGPAGLLVLHGYGNVLERTLGAGERLEVEPGGFLYKDASVSLEVVNLDFGPPEGANRTAAGVKDVASRGFKGLKAARALMKDGVAGAAGQLLGGGGGTALADAFSSTRRATLMSLTGPGRVGIQSMYHHVATE